MRFRASIGILAGDFASQQLAFAHLLDACPGADFDQVEVVARPFDRRLAQWFADGETPDLDAVTEDSLILAFPGSNVALEPTGRLRVVGRFTGTIARALLE